ncbi:pilus assembly protein PilX [Nitrosomonas sp. GH22]|uniref:pilus assembly PilX family protein n=1 Tax=Nitrosomonas sp. GH22 TaxID=153947 RepID=UPI00136AFDE1|nr:PilX N-terminal domain-containing pilus assembly protein [Nitrosomonas sp. GH22]MXS80691.1 pilus assembly protein PilX [Nitrosomonas sp. GH22]
MDADFSADSGNNKDQFFKPRQVASPVVRHVSFTVRIRFLHNHSGGSSQAVPEPSVITPRARICRHHELRNSGMLQHLGAWLSGLLPAPSLGGRNDRINVASTQRGAVLITGLIFLVVLTLLGTTALQSTILEEKMAGNLRDETLAFQAAEAALRSGERFLEQITIPEFNGSNGLYHHACSSAPNPDTEGEEVDEPHSCSPTPDPVTGMAWDADDSREIDVTMDGVANQSRYFIEQLPSVPQMGDGGSAQQSGASLNANMFRIVARGTGGTETAIVLLQSTYRR